MEQDIKQRILKDFGSDSDNAIALVEQFESSLKLSPRISRCIVHLANGSFLNLKKAINDAKTDWRDVIMLAESTDFEFNKPFKI